MLNAVKMALRLCCADSRFQDVLSHVVEVAVQGYAADGTTTYWNSASEFTYGYTPREAVGRKLWDLIIPPEMVSEVKSSVARMIETETPGRPETLLLQRKDGSRVLVRSNHSVTRNANGEPELFCLDVPLDPLVENSSPRPAEDP